MQFSIKSNKKGKKKHMANLFTYLTNEINKGNTLLSRDGNIVSVEKVKQKLKKDFSKDFNSGKIDEDMRFSEYAQPTIDYGFITLDFILNQLGATALEEPEPLEENLPMTPYEEETEPTESVE